MEKRDIYAIKINDINSDWSNYRLWKNGQDIDPDELTIEELEFIQKELFEFSEMFKEQIKYLEEL